MAYTIMAMGLPKTVITIADDIRNSIDDNREAIAGVRKTIVELVEHQRKTREDHARGAAGEPGDAGRSATRG